MGGLRHLGWLGSPYSLKPIITSSSSNILTSGWFYIKKLCLILNVVVVIQMIFWFRFKNRIHVLISHPASTSHIYSNISFCDLWSLNTGTIRSALILSVSHWLLWAIHCHRVSKHLNSLIISSISFLCVCTSNSSTDRSLSIWFCSSVGRPFNQPSFVPIDCIQIKGRVLYQRSSLPSWKQSSIENLFSLIFILRLLFLFVRNAVWVNSLHLINRIEVNLIKSLLLIQFNWVLRRVVHLSNLLIFVRVVVWFKPFCVLVCPSVSFLFVKLLSVWNIICQNQFVCWEICVILIRTDP